MKPSSEAFLYQIYNASMYPDHQEEENSTMLDRRLSKLTPIVLAKHVD